MNNFECFNEIDLACALYHWLKDNYETNGDPLYRAFKTLGAPGSYGLNSYDKIFENIGDDAKYVYDMLTYDNYEILLYRVTGFMPDEYAC
jgi:hypothetical protein